MNGQTKKHPLNVGGSYYVSSSCCANYEFCVYNAPNNFRTDLTGHDGVYVYKQPANAEEEAQCRKALEECPVGAIHNDGES